MYGNWKQTWLIYFFTGNNFFGSIFGCIKINDFRSTETLKPNPEPQLVNETTKLPVSTTGCKLDLSRLDSTSSAYEKSGPRKMRRNELEEVEDTYNCGQKVEIGERLCRLQQALRGTGFFVEKSFHVPFTCRRKSNTIKFCQNDIKCFKILKVLFFFVDNSMQFGMTKFLLMLLFTQYIAILRMVNLRCRKITEKNKKSLEKIN